MHQVHAGLVGLGVHELQEGGHAEADGAAGVATLTPRQRTPQRESRSSEALLVILALSREMGPLLKGPVCKVGESVQGRRGGFYMLQKYL